MLAAFAALTPMTASTGLRFAEGEASARSERLMGAAAALALEKRGRRDDDVEEDRRAELLEPEHLEPEHGEATRRDEELVDDYVTSRVRLHVLTPGTAKNTTCALRRLLRVLHADGRSIVDLEVGDVEGWLEDQHQLSPATRRSRLSSVRQFCRWLMLEGYLVHDPSAMVAAPKQPRSVPRALDAPDVEKVLAKCRDARERAIVWLMVGEGLRCGEVAGLELGDWHRAARTIQVRGKGGHERVLPVVDECARALEAYLEEHPARAGALIRSYRLEWKALEPDTVSKMISELMRKAGVKRAARDGRSAHALRHTAASDVLEASGDLRVVQEMLGHQHLKTTEIYLRRAGLDRMRTAMDDAARRSLG